MAKYRLCDIAPIVQGSVPEADQYWLLNLDMVESNTGRIIDYLYCNEKDIGNSTVKFDTRNVLYSKLRPYLNKVVIPQKPGYATSEMLPLCPDQSIITREYLTYYLRSPGFVSFINEKTSGAKMPRANSADLKSYLLDCPSINEQNSRTHQLDSIVAIMEKRSFEIQKLDDLIKARFVEMFGDMKPTTTLARYIEELRGGKSLAGTEVCQNKVLKTGAATFGWFDPEQYKYLPNDYEPLPEHKVETGDVIISRMNTPELVGACSYVFKAPENMYYPDRLWKVITKDRTNSIFLWQLLWDKEIRRQIKEKSGGTSGTMHNISKPKLLGIKCIDAPYDLQKQYADFVKQVDKSKSVVQKSLDEAQLLFDSLMQKYFG